MDVLTIPHVTHPGLLIAIGGAEDKTRERVILRYFLEAAGGPDASIVVLATASEVPETGERYADLFLALRAENVEVLKIDTREDAMDAGPRGARPAGVRDRPVHHRRQPAQALLGARRHRRSPQTIRRRHAAGMVVAGTSAGAALLSEHMIALGESGAHAAPPAGPSGQGARARARPGDRSAFPPPRPHWGGC